MLDDLLFTLDIARKSLPSDADPIHFARLDTIAGIVRRALDGDDADESTAEHLDNIRRARERFAGYRKGLGLDDAE